MRPPLLCTKFHIVSSSKDMIEFKHGSDCKNVCGRVCDHISGNKSINI